MNKSSNCEELIFRIMSIEHSGKSPKCLINRCKLKKQPKQRSISPRFLWLSKYTRNKDKMKSELLHQRFNTINYEEQSRPIRVASALSRPEKPKFFQQKQTKETKEVQIKGCYEEEYILNDANIQEKDNRNVSITFHPRLQRKRQIKTSNENRSQSRLYLFQPTFQGPTQSSRQCRMTPKNIYDSIKSKDQQTKRSMKTIVHNPPALYTQQVHLQNPLPPRQKRVLTANNSHKHRIPKPIKEMKQIPIRPWDYQNDENEISGYM